MFSSFHSLNTFVFSSLESKLVRSRVSSSPLTHQMRESRETGSRNPAGQPTHRKLTLAEPGVLGGTGSTEHRGRRACPDRKSTRLNSSHLVISYAVFCLK